MARIITEPTITVIARMVFDRPAMQPYLDGIGAGEWDTDARGGDALCEAAGRICYRSFAAPRPGGNHAYLERIKSEGHGSVLEHASWTLLLAGISRNLTHEFVRHRAGFAYSQRSQRYCDDSDIGFVLPPALAGSKGTAPHADWVAAVGDAVARYERQVRWMIANHGGGNSTDIRKAAREAARSVLPGCTATELVVTGNARAWRHWLEARGSRHAEAEIRRLAFAVLPVLKREAPNIFGDYYDDDGQIEADDRKV